MGKGDRAGAGFMKTLRICPSEYDVAVLEGTRGINNTAFVIYASANVAFETFEVFEASYILLTNCRGAS